MQAVGVVVEYNPFHNGHHYHIKESKKKTDADVVVAVMSGNFLQRGEPALVDKWHRTKMALLSGVDMVIELPYVFATSKAEQFARGAIQILTAMKCDTFAFGSEDGNIEPFLNTLMLLHDERTEYNDLIKYYISKGNSYPKSLYEAYEQLKQKRPQLYIDLSQPNNILGYHYIEAVHQIKSSIQPVTIQRVKAGYHDDVKQDSSIASATGIRKALFESGELSDVLQFVPPHSYEQLQLWAQNHQQFVQWESFWPLLRFTIARYLPKDLTQFADVSEGIEFALIKYAKMSDSFQTFMNHIKSKRYTWTRLQRMLTHIFTGVTKEQLHQFESPTYIRLLGMTNKGQQFLGLKKKEFELPLISRVAQTKDPLLQIDIRATEIYGQGIQLFSNKKIDGDYQTPPIRI
ncbi:nucleotidyltransferase [Ureibacillus sp. MALMAid1270]|uniref:nucleotidyltransferase n=1 Tax=Ureibacillus sp. MALMAid1270 TaxID=3411629 RepID=UPI003BA75DCA